MSEFSETTFNPNPPPTPSRHRRLKHGPEACGGPAKCGHCAVRFYVEEYEPVVLPTVAAAKAEIERLNLALKESGHEHQFVQLGYEYEKYLDGKPIRGRTWQKLYCTRCAQPVEITARDRRYVEDTA